MVEAISWYITANGTYTKTVPVKGAINASYIVEEIGTSTTTDIAINISDADGTVRQVIATLTDVAASTSADVGPIYPGYPSIVVGQFTGTAFRITLLMEA